MSPRSKLIMMKRLFVAIFCLVSLFSAAQAHRYHTSLTRIDYNEKEQTAQITIQTFSDDLEAALAASHGSRVNIDKTKDLDKIALKYLAASFVLTDAAGAAKELKWIGFERQSDGVYLYLEAAMPDGFMNATLENRFLFDRFPGQINLVTVRADDKKYDLIFKPGGKLQNLIENTNGKSASD